MHMHQKLVANHMQEVNNNMKKWICVILAMSLMISCIGCKRRPIKNEENIKFKVGLVTDVGGVNDQGFNQITWQGIKKYEKEHPEVMVSYLESKIDADYAMNIQIFIENDYDLIIGPGGLMTNALKEAAINNPNKTFMMIDNNDIDLPNVINTVFSVEQAAFLAGVVAAKMTKTNVVGFISGMNVLTVNQFGIGYMQGVQYIDKNIQIILSNINSFSDPTAGTAHAKAMIAADADIIHVAAGGSGIGVINSCAENNMYAIGCDIDQAYLSPKHVLTSVVKNIDVAVYDLLDEVINNNLRNGTKVFDIVNGGVGLAKTRELISQDVWNEVEKVKNLIKKGDIVVENDPSKCPYYTIDKK